MATGFLSYTQGVSGLTQWWNSKPISLCSAKFIPLQLSCVLEKNGGTNPCIVMDSFMKME